MKEATLPRGGVEPSSDGEDRHRSVSLRDVATAAGVAHQTVSRVVNGSPRGKRDTRERVLRVIEELGCKPNRLARAPAGGVVSSVTVLTSDTTLYGASLALRGIEEAARAADFALSAGVLDERARLTPDDVAHRLARPGNRSWSSPSKRPVNRPGERCPTSSPPRRWWSGRSGSTPAAGRRNGWTTGPPRPRPPGTRSDSGTETSTA